MSSIFGGSKSSQTSSSSSSNQAYDSLNQAFSPTFGYAQSGGDALQALLSGDASGFNAYKKATGFDAMAEQGSRGITNNAAAAGLLRSGSTGKNLASFYAGLQDQFAGNYMDRLMGLAGLGLQGGQVVSGAGNVMESQSQGTSSQKPGIGKFLGTIGAGIAASDRRLKKNIFKIGELSNGLTLYQYRYLNNEGPYLGVMADEVEALQPEALGPEIGGYRTVNYAALGV